MSEETSQKSYNKLIDMIIATVVTIFILLSILMITMYNTSQIVIDSPSRYSTFYTENITIRNNTYRGIDMTNVLTIKVDNGKIDEINKNRITLQLNNKNFNFILIEKENNHTRIIKTGDKITLNTTEQIIKSIQTKYYTTFRINSQKYRLYIIRLDNTTKQEEVSMSIIVNNKEYRGTTIYII